MGRSQGLNIDTFLLKSIKVQDSNVGASYGHFTGGVIEAETKRAEKDFGVNFAYQISQGNANDGAFSLTRYHVYGDKQNFLNSSSPDKQPKFVRHSFRSSLETKVNEKLGIIASFTTTQSFIPIKEFDDVSFSSVERTQKRQSYNFFIKSDYQVSDDVALVASYGYMPQFGIYYQENAKNSKTTMKNGGHMLNTEATIGNSLGFFTANASFSYMEESRRSDSAILKTWYYSQGDKDWGDPQSDQIEGSFGDEDNKQSDLSLKIAQNFEPYYNDSFENGFNIGAEFSYTYAYFKRLKDSYEATGSDMIATQGQCQINDPWCSSTPMPDVDWGQNYGQYFTALNEYKAGKASMDNVQTALFVENESKFDLGNKGDISARIGLRADYDTYMQKAPIAPRFSANYTAPWGKDEFRYNTSFTFGANRYYGRNMYSFKLNQIKSKLYKVYERADVIDPWTENNLAQGLDEYDFTRLKIPYADELMFGVVQEVGLFDVSSKYIHRFGRDEVRVVCGRKDNNGDCLSYTYDNQDKSDTDVITLSIMNNTPFMAGGFSNFFSFAFDYTHTTRSYNDYQKSEEYNPNDDKFVSYNGKIQRLSELPVTNFAQPLSFRFSTTHAINLLRTNWTLNNFFRVRMPYNATTIAYDENGNALGGDGSSPDQAILYEDYRIPTRFTWDLRLGIEKAVYGKNTLYFNVDVYNVLDKTNLTVRKDTKNLSKNSGGLAYELGRQFWLEIGYRY
ncbi:TonB-dependent receptor [Campylobacter sp. MIT 99-7217]|nr:TonB-dependent receptor [Campylobacter sp. MIT 99-7217]